jgi:hypothetical protein
MLTSALKIDGMFLQNVCIYLQVHTDLLLSRPIYIHNVMNTQICSIWIRSVESCETTTPIGQLIGLCVHIAGTVYGLTNASINIFMKMVT